MRIRRIFFATTTTPFLFNINIGVTFFPFINFAFLTHHENKHKQNHFVLLFSEPFIFPSKRKSKCFVMYLSSSCSVCSPWHNFQFETDHQFHFVVAIFFRHITKMKATIFRNSIHVRKFVLKMISHLNIFRCVKPTNNIVSQVPTFYLAKVLQFPSLGQDTPHVLACSSCSK